VAAQCRDPASTAGEPSLSEVAGPHLHRSLRKGHLPLLEDAVRKLAPFLDEIVFVGGITLGLLITDKAAAPIRGTNDVDVIAEIVTYADYIAFSERLRCRGHRHAGTGSATAEPTAVLDAAWSC
jgi:hypothetical protein